MPLKPSEAFLSLRLACAKFPLPQQQPRFDDMCCTVLLQTVSKESGP